MILGIDPGRDKCGIAVLDSKLNRYFKEVVSTSKMEKKVKELKGQFNIQKVVLGDGTKSEDFQKKLSRYFSEIILVDEYKSTLEARDYYWKENPPKGWRRLIPLSLQTPLQPIDDYVAVILVERHLKD
ncbi:pre-16S rRNA-processing nuclease YqgF [Halonatronum saccharophilum]|uniref:pre-16S rRNA-processing nuclease YqgF n=1 Tax=Halonatronum saccharophilum TaxID=150060 RepID=UPI0004886466|nr:pre-16S rRNA-processing nuclease YqgF [Halonatronum saccharophilum]